MRQPSILVIAATDSTGAAGLFNDLQVVSAFGARGLGAVTAVTVQDAGGVRALHAIPVDFVVAQIRAALGEIESCPSVKPTAIAIGALGTAATARAVSDLVGGVNVPVVLDPVLSASAGGDLAGAGTLEALRDSFLPAATVVTPNLSEAGRFCGFEVKDRPSVERAASALRQMGARAVLIKGGHLAGAPADLLDDGTRRTWMEAGARLPGEFRGTGGALATAIAIGLARGEPLIDAVRAARVYLLSLLEIAAVSAPMERPRRLDPHAPFRGRELRGDEDVV